MILTFFPPKKLDLVQLKSELLAAGFDVTRGLGVIGDPPYDIFTYDPRGVAQDISVLALPTIAAHTPAPSAVLGAFTIQLAQLAQLITDAPNFTTQAQVNTSLVLLATIQQTILKWIKDRT